MMDAIDVYLDTILTPQLEHMGMQSFPGAIEAVVTDIRRRLQSVLLHDARLLDGLELSHQIVLANLSKELGSS